MKPRVVLADTHLILLEGLQRLSDGRFEVVGVATSGTELLQVARRTKPDVIICDLALPTLHGVDAIAELQLEKNHAHIVYLSENDEMDAVMRAFRAGAAGYVLKQSSCSELFSAVDEVLQGRRYLTPRIATELVGAVIKSTSGKVGNTERKGGQTMLLTRRQMEVLRLIAQGKTMKEVAGVLGISTRTAEAHKYQMMEHLGVRSVPELVQRGIALGVVEMPELKQSAA